MTLWVRNGTVSVTNGSAAVTGTGTTWAANRDVVPGHGFRGPDGKMYEVLSIASDTSLTLASNYEGGTASGQAYAIVPVPYAFVADVIERVNYLISRLTSTVNIPALLVGAPSITSGVAAAIKGIRSVFESTGSISIDIFKGSATDYATIGFYSGASQRAQLQLDNQNAFRHWHNDGTTWNLPFYVAPNSHPYLYQGVNFPNLASPPTGFGDGSVWQQGVKLKVREGGVTKNIFRTENAGFRNLFMNPRFHINQRNVTGTVTLSPGQYGHDGVKAGAAGATYTFDFVGDWRITVSAGSVILPVEWSTMSVSSTCVLSANGTAQARIWQGGGFTGSGAYQSPPFTQILSGGTQTNVEFGVGTIHLPQLELGDEPSSFERRPLQFDLLFCRRYFQVYLGKNVGISSVAGDVELRARVDRMYTIPSLQAVANVGLYVPGRAATSVAPAGITSLSGIDQESFILYIATGSPALATAEPVNVYDARIYLSAEL